MIHLALCKALLLHHSNLGGRTINVEVTCGGKSGTGSREIKLRGLRTQQRLTDSQKVDAIVQMLREDGLPTAQADAIAGTLAGTINDLSSRVTDGSQPQLVNALQRALLAVRNQLSGIAASARTKLLASIAPSLEGLTKMKGAPPKGIAEAHLDTTFQAVVNTAGLLQKVRATGGAGA